MRGVMDVGSGLPAAACPGPLAEYTLVELVSSVLANCDDCHENEDGEENLRSALASPHLSCM